ncbi:Type 1 glutamine amidotransferase-like domain-containing protein [Mucilaginibacter sp. X4EP1]|uniref:Type 1 glutamine amidotransferase-like domain-containing protein n=1 Tax=Mucilaginibacter sp. X4EP1 TaxID=2723092 RepID=UPI002169E738|nr:Type 1 glutamine amidotransferase-like domain-containing protein [Mucilaginibacter sp. X4EP1]MCS3814019.1 dipeptidase E [Mucilaginibacter sp. X4EP1]
MRLLLTSNGISNQSIQNALVELLGKPIAESNALFIPTAIYPFAFGARYAWNPISGNTQSPFCNLGWKSIGLLELTALPSIQKEIWMQAVLETDALLVWGGDPIYLSYWLRESGLADLLPSLLQKMVYVGVSAGSIAASTTFAETYSRPRGGNGTPLSSENVVFVTAQEEEISMNLITAHGAGLVDFAIIPHLDNKQHVSASITNAEKWAAKISVPVYAIDDQTAIKVVDGVVEVVSEGHWKLFTP